MTIYYNTETKRYYKVVNVFAGTIKVKEQGVPNAPEQTMKQDEYYTKLQQGKIECR